MANNLHGPGILAPSMMCTDYRHLEEDLKKMKEMGVQYLHMDVMDGVFVPNYTLGPDFMKMVEKMTDIPLDIHLMVVNPEQHLDAFPIRPCDTVSIHYEATTHVQRTLQLIKAKGAKAFLALNPATPLLALDYVWDVIDGVLVMTVNPGFAGQKIVPATIRKVAECRKYLDERGRGDCLIEVDGNINVPNAKALREAGADWYVGGTSGMFTDGALDENKYRAVCEVIR